MSWPRALSGEVAGSRMSGSAPALAEAGKVMTRESEAGVERDTEALQSSGRVAVEGEAVQVPAVAGVVDALAQQAQALQPGVCMALAVQQQPERQSVEAQSKEEAQASPGEKVAQEPVPGAQALQFMRVAAALQQKPPRQAAPKRQVASEAQAVPVETAVAKLREVEHCTAEVAPANGVVRPGGQGLQAVAPGAE
jgi:hypothetical protein